MFLLHMRCSQVSTLAPIHLWYLHCLRPLALLLLVLQLFSEMPPRKAASNLLECGRRRAAEKRTSSANKEKTDEGIGSVTQRGYDYARVLRDGYVNSLSFTIGRD